MINIDGGLRTVSELLRTVGEFIGLLSRIPHRTSREPSRRRPSEPLKRKLELFEDLKDGGNYDSARRLGKDLLSESEVLSLPEQHLHLLVSLEFIGHKVGDVSLQSDALLKAGRLTGALFQWSEGAIETCSGEALLAAVESLIDHAYVAAERRTNLSGAITKLRLAHEIMAKIRDSGVDLGRATQRERVAFGRKVLQLSRRAAHNLADAHIRRIHDSRSGVGELEMTLGIQELIRESLEIQTTEGRVLPETLVNLLELWEATGDVARLNMAYRESLAVLRRKEARSARLDLHDQVRRSEWLNRLSGRRTFQEFLEDVDQLAAEEEDKINMGWKHVAHMGAAVVVSLALMGFSMNDTSSLSMHQPSSHVVVPQGNAPGPCFYLTEKQIQKRGVNPCTFVAEKQIKFRPSAPCYVEPQSSKCEGGYTVNEGSGPQKNLNALVEERPRKT